MLNELPLREHAKSMLKGINAKQMIPKALLLLDPVELPNKGASGKQLMLKELPLLEHMKPMMEGIDAKQMIPIALLLLEPVELPKKGAGDKQLMLKEFYMYDMKFGDK
ncbi:hypothetical protein AVEN_49820-1 [Araneus ventricosus]|uniref:Uncharacterized protein n=1 Tax=Araneus ventricosus TaxID=182803 RepID=A0A4Y2JLQ2_ARAVE|nr:hypothetical protein AVEN_49820-1 [Araneus ventricosus]